MSYTVKTLSAVLLLTSLSCVADDIVELNKRLAKEGERNAVLNLLEIGARQFHQQQYPAATVAFDDALNNIESFYSNKEAAHKARSLWHEEGRKDFKGEPYERVMAYYYRGLLYLQQKDWGNARASFEGGMLQDAFAEEEQHIFDFALMSYLSAWASHREGNASLKQRSMKELDILRPNYPKIADNHNTLLIVETGTAPRKLRDGVGHYDLVYRRGKNFTEEKVTLSTGGSTINVYPMEDIYWQASSRGGRAIDRIIKNKVNFRDTNADVGGVLMNTAATLQLLQPLSDKLGPAARTLGLIGVAQLYVSSKVNTKADNRYWSAIPDAVHVYSFNSKDIKSAEVKFADKNGKPLPELTKKIHMPADGGLVWVQSRPAPPPPKSITKL